MSRFDGYNRNDFHYPRTSREAFGDEFHVDKPVSKWSIAKTLVVWTVCAWLVLVLLFGLTGCDKKIAPDTKQQRQEREFYAKQTDFQITYLFNEDGCNVYRFHDRQASHYFVSCKGNTTTEYTCGKQKCREDISTGGM